MGVPPPPARDSTTNIHSPGFAFTEAFPTTAKGQIVESSLGRQSSLILVEQGHNPGAFWTLPAEASHNKARPSGATLSQLNFVAL